MFRTLRNLIVNILAAFIRDRDARHKFRDKYKIKSKFKKLRDDNRRLFRENRRLFIENKTIISKLTRLENLIDESRSTLWGWPSVLKGVEDLSIVTPPCKLQPVYLSIACIAKDEGPYIKEWIEYHKIVGVERIYFYDNDSSDNTKEILAPYINDGTVIYHYFKGRRQQQRSYEDAILRYGGQAYWMALIDLDEFMVPKEKENISDFLKDYEQYPGVLINSVGFDSNGHETKPTKHGGLVTANYMMVHANYDKWNGSRIVKSIIRPGCVAKFYHTHQPLYKGWISAVTENFEPVYGYASPTGSIKKIQLNHYGCKSKEEYIKKIEKWSTEPGGGKIHHKYNDAALNYLNVTTDYAIQKFIPKLKIAMGIEE